MWERDAVIAEERGRVTFVVALGTTTLHHCLLVDGESRSSGSVSLQSASDDLETDDAQALAAAGSGNAEDAYTAITGRAGTCRR